MPYIVQLLQEHPCVVIMKDKLQFRTVMLESYLVYVRQSKGRPAVQLTAQPLAFLVGCYSNNGSRQCMSSLTQ